MQLMEYAMQAVGTLPRDYVREAIRGMQEHLLSCGENIPVESCPVRHTFAPGCYAREITMFEDMVVIGKIHKHAHLNIISAGRCRVLTEHGCEELVAPCTFVSEPGTKRLVYVLEDTVWTTIHITNETDLDKIEAEIIAKDYSEIEVDGHLLAEEVVCLGD